jgi:ABC-type nitrate/sulfonate/bicarbonate transport system substrate-binding protein
MIVKFLLCLGLASAGSVGLGAPAAEGGRLRVMVQLDWIKNAQFAGVLVAEERGWYREAGLDVEVRAVDPEKPDAVAPVVAHPGIAIGVADGSALLRARAGGAPIKAFATMFQASPLGIVTLKTSGLTTVASLRGKTIGLHGYDRPQLAIMLRHAGLMMADVTAIDIGDDVHSLPAGRIQAQVCYVIDEAVALETAGHAVNTMFGHENGYKAYAQVYFTTALTLGRHGPVLARFLEASNRGWRAAIADPEGTALMIIERHQPKLKVDYQAGSIALIAKLLTAETGTGGMGRMRRETWLETSDATPTLVDQLVDFRLQPETGATTLNKP